MFSHNQNSLMTKLTNKPDWTDSNRDEPHLPIKLSRWGKCSKELNDDYLLNSKQQAINGMSISQMYKKMWLGGTGEEEWVPGAQWWYRWCPQKGDSWELLGRCLFHLAFVHWTRWKSNKFRNQFVFCSAQAFLLYRGLNIFYLADDKRIEDDGILHSLRILVTLQMKDTYSTEIED